MGKARLIKIWIFLMRAGLTIIYQLLLIVTCLVLALFIISPVCMAMVCIALKLDRLPETGLFIAWMTGCGFTAIPIYIVEEIKYLKRRKEETLQRMKEKSEAIKE